MYGRGDFTGLDCIKEKAPYPILDRGPTSYEVTEKDYRQAIAATAAAASVVSIRLSSVSRAVPKRYE